MNYLNIQAVNTTKRRCEVAWYVGENRNGVINIKFEGMVDNAKFLGEYYALQYLLFTKNILTNKVFDGKGVQINFTSGKLRKLMLAKTPDPLLGKEPLVLFSRLTLAKFKVVRNLSSEILDLCFQKEIESVDLSTSNLNLDFSTIDSPLIGKVAVTYHFLERFNERFIDIQQKGLGSKWKTIDKLISSEQLTPYELPEDILKKKNLRYGENRQEFWLHSGTGLVFIIAKSLVNQSVLVSVFESNRTH